MRNIIDDGSFTGASQDPAGIFPVDNATVPYWRSELHRIDEYSSEFCPPMCDIAIIGAGMSGVATAYHLTNGIDKDKLPSIVLFEARQVCSGATGRNGGHCKIKTSSIQKLIKRHGLEAATEVVDLVREQMYAIKHVVETEKLDCDFELRRSYDVFRDEKEAEQARQDFEASLKAGQKWTREVDFVGEKYAEQITSVKGAKAALGMPCASFWPYKFVSQLLARLLERQAINLQTNTCVTQMSRITGPSDDRGNMLFTSRGIVVAKRVIFATNGYTGGLSHDYLNTIVPTRGTAVHIRPASSVSPHLSRTYNISYGPGPGRVDYLNPRPDGTIVVGGGQWTYSADRSRWYNNWDDSTLLEEVKPHFEGLMQRYFHGWEDSKAEMDYIWTGIMGNTPDELPHIGMVPESRGTQYIIAGFNGGGNALIFLSARGLAKIMQEGVAFEDTGLPRLFQTSRQRLTSHSWRRE